MVIALIIILAVLIIAALIGLYAAYRKTFYSSTKGMSETELPPAISEQKYRDMIAEKVKELGDLPCEYIHARSYDGLRLCGRFYMGNEDMPLCICFHGYRGSALRDHAGVATYLLEKGYSVLIIDERAHWRSQGHTICYGIKERYDVLSWLEFAKRRFGAEHPVFLFGISMGASTVLMASGQELPDSVKGIIADCPYSSPKDIIKHVCVMIKMNPTLSWPAIWLSGIIYGHVNVKAATAADEVKKATKPILIAHGEGDNFVPMSMSKEIYEANPELIEYHTYPEAGHGLSCVYDTDRYKKMLDSFMERCMGE